MYLLDANIFLEAQNRYYAADICPGFWDWLDHAKQEGLVGSIVGVHDELVGHGDALAAWVGQRRHTGWFVDADDAATQAAFHGVVTFVEAAPRYSRINKDLFLSGADPWLIAKARTMGVAVATHEQFVEANSTKVKIPNVCHNFGVQYCDTFEVLRQLRASFGWQRAAA